MKERAEDGGTQTGKGRCEGRTVGRPVERGLLRGSAGRVSWRSKLSSGEMEIGVLEGAVAYTLSRKRGVGVNKSIYKQSVSQNKGTRLCQGGVDSCSWLQKISEHVKQNKVSIYVQGFRKISKRREQNTLSIYVQRTIHWPLFTLKMNVFKRKRGNESKRHCPQHG